MTLRRLPDPPPAYCWMLSTLDTAHAVHETEALGVCRLRTARGDLRGPVTAARRLCSTCLERLGIEAELGEPIGDAR